MDRLSRREFLARAGAAVAAAALTGCGDQVSTEPVAPEASGLDHILVVTMENRSFDHLLGWLPGADGRQAGLSYPDRNGVAQPTHHLTDFQGCGFADPSHSFAGGRAEYNGGACDGWLTAEGNDRYAIGYYQAADLPFLGQAAPAWHVLDRYFTPFMGPTLPNRLVAHAGQTDRLANTAVLCTLPTIWDRLAAAGLTGANYGYGRVTLSAWGDRYAGLIKPIAAFYSDCAAGTLPNLAFVDPDFATAYSNDYHPPADIRAAEAFLAQVYRAVTTSPAWDSSLLVITFDEWGGFFDHVPPPIAPLPEAERQAGNLDGLRGFRIPTVLVSPFARRRHVSSTLYDHASVLRMVEWRWGLDPLTVRDESANNLALELDFRRPNPAAPPIAIPSGPFAGPCT